MAGAPLASSSVVRSASGHKPESTAHGIVSPAGITPEMFGATGDGRTDDSPALQHALNAAAEAERGHALVILQPKTAYRCDSGLEMDCSRVSIWGQGLLDFSNHRGICLRVNASSIAVPLTPANNYGHRGTISGALRLKGGGQAKTSLGVQFDSDEVATSAQLLVENLSVSGCAIGVEFARRAYNNTFIRCDIFECGTCIRMIEAEDNGERNLLLGCSLYNSEVAVSVDQPSAALYLQNCSLDYTSTLYKVSRGLVFATDCHHESSHWTHRPILCESSGAIVHISGGVIVGQTDTLPADYLIEAAAGASVRLDGVFLHNIRLSAAPERDTAWATGVGETHITRMETLEYSSLPIRLHAERTGLADPNFDALEWQDPIWRLANGEVAVASRHGESGEPLVLRRVSAGTPRALGVSRRGGGPASLALMALPVRPGEAVLAGFRVCRDQRRPGRGGTLGVKPTWARIDSFNAAHVPVLTRQEATGVLEITADEQYRLVNPIGSRSNRFAPSWATHFVMIVDLTRFDGDLMFRGLWGDVM